MPEFPWIAPEDMERIGRLFDAYIFYETDRSTGDRRCWSTCCGAEFAVEALPRTMTPEWRELMQAQHNREVRCPKCGRAVTLKNLGKAKSRKSLEAWGKVTVLQVGEGGVLFAQAFYLKKSYQETLRPLVELMPKARYYFAPGVAEGWRYTCADWRARRWGWTPMVTVNDPFPGGMGYFTYVEPGSPTVGLERLEQSFLRYCAYDRWERRASEGRIQSEGGFSDGDLHTHLFRYLAVAALHPQIEMLVKMGLWDMVHDLVVNKRKGAGVDWRQKDPRKAFGLTKEELRYFAGRGGPLELLRLYQRAKRKKWGMSIREMDGILALERSWLGGGHKGFLSWVEKLGVGPREAMAYLGKQAGTAERAWGLWRDYLEAAEFLDYDLSVHNVMFPKDLQDAHDRAAANRTAVEAEQSKALLAERTAELDLRYGFALGGYFIRAPESVQEIVAEGKALSHCVGGYAARHAKGEVTILFLRTVDAPDKPLVTLEMDGKRLVQAQGYKNDGVACRENPGRVPARKLYAGILDPWLAWVAAGSKRDKRGQPKLPAKKKKKEVHAA